MSPINANPGAGGARVSDNFRNTAASTSRNQTPAQGKLTVCCREFKPLVRNTLRGFAEIYIAEMKLTVRDVAVHTKGERRWAQLPAKPHVKDGVLVKGEDGKVQYIHLMSWDTRAVADAFSDAVVKAVLELVPDAFDTEGVS
jgi:hypothetical protein